MTVSGHRAPRWRIAFLLLGAVLAFPSISYAQACWFQIDTSQFGEGQYTPPPPYARGFNLTGQTFYQGCLFQLEQATATFDGTTKIIWDPGSQPVPNIPNGISEGAHTVLFEARANTVTTTPDGGFQISGDGVRVFTSQTVNYTVDKTAPKMTVISPGPEPPLIIFSATGTITFSGTVTDNFFVENVIVGGNVIPIKGASGNWSFTVPAATAQGDWIFSAWDAAGNHVQPRCGTPPEALCTEDPNLERGVTVDSTPPGVSVDSPQANSTISSFTSVTVRATDNLALHNIALQIRENSTGKFWDGSGFNSPDPVVNTKNVTGGITPTVFTGTTSFSWTYTLASPVVFPDSYTIIAQATDWVGALSGVTYSTVTIGPPPLDKEGDRSSKGNSGKVSFDPPMIYVPYAVKVPQTSCVTIDTSIAQQLTITHDNVQNPGNGLKFSIGSTPSCPVQFTVWSNPDSCIAEDRLDVYLGNDIVGSLTATIHIPIQETATKTSSNLGFGNLSSCSIFQNPNNPDYIACIYDLYSITISGPTDVTGIASDKDKLMVYENLTTLQPYSPKGGLAKLCSSATRTNNYPATQISGGIQVFDVNGWGVKAGTLSDCGDQNQQTFVVGTVASESNHACAFGPIHLSKYLGPLPDQRIQPPHLTGQITTSREDAGNIIQPAHQWKN